MAEAECNALLSLGEVGQGRESRSGCFARTLEPYVAGGGPNAVKDILHLIFQRFCRSNVRQNVEGSANSPHSGIDSRSISSEFERFQSALIGSWAYRPDYHDGQRQHM